MTFPLIDDRTLLHCGIYLTVRCVQGESEAEHNVYFSPEAVASASLSVAGSALQRQVYESLRIAASECIAAEAGK